MTRPPRILIVSHHGLPHVGGVEVLVDQEIRVLAEAGCEVVHVTSDLLGQGQRPNYPPQVRVIRVPAWHGLERRARLAYPVFSPRLLHVLWREVQWADVVHAHGFIFLSSVAALSLAAYFGKPRLLTDHGGIMPLATPWLNLLMQTAARSLGRWSTRQASRLVAYNRRVLGDLEYLSGTRRKSLFQPYFVDSALFHPPTPEERERLRERLGWQDARPKVLFVGRITADKGVLLLLEAHRLIATHADIDLVICGPGDPDLLNLPRPGVVYLSPRPQAEVAELYRAADLLVLPSKPGREGFPLVVREALASGLKVVMSYEPGYAPYRAVPNLFFTDLEPRAIAQTIEATLALPTQPPGTHPDLSPTPREWLSRLYGPYVPALRCQVH